MAAAVIILSILLIAVLAIVSFDFIPFFADMFGRRGMGGFSSREEWLEKAEGICENWLENGLPVVPKNAEKKYAFFELVKGEGKVETIQRWQEASVLLAVNEADSEKAAEFINAKLSQEDFSDKDRVDAAMLAYAMIKNRSIDKERIKSYMDKMADILLEKYERTGNIPYCANDNLFFVDTIGLVCPFLAAYAVEYGNKTALEAAVKTITDFSENGIHKKLGLPVHCYDGRNGAPLGIYGWGRGCGWWAVGLAETFDALNGEDGFTQEKTVILKAMIDFADVITDYQCSNGAFDRTVLSFTGEDSSATAMLAFFLAYTGNLSKREKYLKSAYEAVNYIYTVTRKDGTVDYSQGDTMGVGYYSSASIVLPAAQGFAVRACRLMEG